MSGNELPREIERKYVIELPDEELLRTLPECDITEIVQTYLKDDGSGMYRRVRKRGTAERGYKYYLTAKRDVAFGERIEIEDEIGEEQYEELLKEADGSRRPVEKKRCTFVYDGQFFELDIYSFSNELATLEIELDSIDTEVRLPECLRVLRDVTGDKRYGNMRLAAEQRLELLD